RVKSLLFCLLLVTSETSCWLMLLLGEQQVQNPASADMLALLPAMAQDVFFGTPRLLQRVCQDWQGVELRLFVARTSQRHHRAAIPLQPARVDPDRTERVAEDLTQQPAVCQTKMLPFSVGIDRVLEQHARMDVAPGRGPGSVSSDRPLVGGPGIAPDPPGPVRGVAPILAGACRRKGGFQLFGTDPSVRVHGTRLAGPPAGWVGERVPEPPARGCEEEPPLALAGAILQVRQKCPRLGAFPPLDLVHWLSSPMRERPSSTAGAAGKPVYHGAP